MFSKDMHYSPSDLATFLNASFHMRVWQSWRHGHQRSDDRPDSWSSNDCHARYGCAYHGCQETWNCIREVERHIEQYGCKTIEGGRHKRKCGRRKHKSLKTSLVARLVLPFARTSCSGSSCQTRSGSLHLSVPPES